MDRIDSRKEFTRMMEQYMKLVYSICVKMTNDHFAAEDLTQETFLSALKALKNFDGENEKAWICRIATNKCIDYKRKKSTHDVVTDTFPDVLASRDGNPDATYMETEARDRLENACKQLKPPYDRIAKLYYLQEYKADEIAKLEDRNIKTVQTQIYRARGMLRKFYEKEGYHHGI